MNNKNTYWVDFWNAYSKNCTGQDEHSQVLRTLNKIPISKEKWAFTLLNIENIVTPKETDALLEMCCGNGLISQHLSTKVNTIVAVDISPNLIDLIDTSVYKNITPISADIRDLEFGKNSFDKIIIYAGIQYFSLSETVKLFEKIYSWLKPGGVVLFGDIPDKLKLWDFYNTKERETLYFQNTKEGIDVIGTWFDKGFFKRLSDFVGFCNAEFIVQDKRLIYSNFRYDLKLTK